MLLTHEAATTPAAWPKRRPVMILSEKLLSGSGKISKLLLRRKSTSATVRGELDRSGLADRLHVAVVDDRLTGEVVMMVTCSTPFAADEDHRAEASAVLNGYATEFRRTNDVAVCDGDKAERGDRRQVEAVRL